MDMPAWLIEILRQFPMVVAIGLAVWYAEKRVSSKEIRLEERYDKNWKEAADREDQIRQEARRDRDAEIQRMRETEMRVLASKDDLIANLNKQVANLTKRLLDLIGRQP